MIQIPRQLQHPDFRFLRLQKKEKKPIAEETNWQNNNLKFDDPKLLEHLAKDMNYAIIGGYGKLILIDADTPEIEKICEKMIETFTVKTGSPEDWKKHYFFITDKKMKGIRLTKEKVGDLGDVRSIGQYVVAPNSIHPKGNKYLVLKDLPIAKIGVEQIKEYFKDYIGSGGSETFKEYPTITTKRSDDFIRNCKMPDYVINNKMKGETSKNWELFPYLVDILHNREVTQQVYIDLCKRQGHNVGAIKGWVIKAHEGKLMKCNCEKMQNYIDKFHPDLKNEICGNCFLFKKEKAEEEYLFGEFGKLTNYLNIAEEFLKKQPIYYDKNKLWWIWNFKEFKWELIDETDILNCIDDVTKNPSTNTIIKNELLESLRRKSRKNKPKAIKPTWIQFKDTIIDINNGEQFKASSEYFVTNPIPYNLNNENFEETPTIDKIFEEWVGKDYVKTLYEILAYCLIPAYPIHRLFCFVGSGMNGKSKYLELLRKFVGESNCCSTELDTLIQSRFEITRLHKKLVCQMGETNFNEMNRTSIIKKLTGGDLIGYEYKNKNPFEEKNYAKIIIATNNLPTTTDKTIGFYRRWCIIDFPNQFSEKKDILGDIPEEEYESLALKCTGILKDLLNKREFHKEGSVEDRMAKYEAKSDFLQKFLDDYIDDDINSDITKSDFYKKFSEWCIENRHRKLAENTLGKKMKDKGIEEGRRYADWLHDGKGGQMRVWRGIKWK